VSDCAFLTLHDSLYHPSHGSLLLLLAAAAAAGDRS
jgi:hypothetical protein